MTNITTKKVFFPEVGTGLTLNDVYSLCDYYDRTGEYPNHFTENDIEAFDKKYIKPNQNINDLHMYQ